MSEIVVVTDAEVRAALDARSAVTWMGEAVDAHHRGDLVAPPRLASDLGDGRLVFTVGRRRGAWWGYRSYDTFGADPGAQVIVVQEEASGGVRAVAVGNEIGRRRVGAIGGVAAAALSPSGASTLAVIGSGAQAWAQVWAICAVRPIDSVRVWSRDEHRRSTFVESIRPLVQGCSEVAADARTALAGADLVILATNSPTPVIDPYWLEPHAYVATLGPKQRGRSEFGVELAEWAGLLVTDSPEQLSAYDPPNVLVGTDHEGRLVSLGAVRAENALRAGRGGTVFFSVGLAGTEAWLVAELASVVTAT